MENNIKIQEIILNKFNEYGSFLNMDDVFVGCYQNMDLSEKILFNAFREYAQIACSNLSEEIRQKDERIEELEESLKEINNLYQQWKKDEINDGVFSVLIYNQLLLTPPTNP